LSKLGVIQTRKYSSNKSGIDSVSKALLGLARREADVVCLPEQWLASNVVADFEAEFAAFRRISRDHSMAIIPGAFYEKVGRDYFISAPVIDSGEIIGKQQKIHPFDYEKLKIRPGSRAQVFRAGGIRLGIIICYDMVFPGVAEFLAKKGADVLFSPSRIVRRGVLPWHTYVQARSLENRIPILAANVHDAKFGGKSIIVDLEEDSGVMIPRVRKSPAGQASMSVSLCPSRYRVSRLQRYKDLQRFS
jgi:predicted amidohydrolase